MKCIFITIPLMLFTLCSIAQKQNNNWVIGAHAGINFNTQPPTAYHTANDHREGGASVSDRNTGDLLFYTDGVTLWDNNNNIMLNGDTIGTDTRYTGIQNSLIIPNIKNENQYYVFTLESQLPSKGRLFYSIVDMTLNSGLGAVVPGQKMIMVDSNFLEGMYYTPTCNGYWLLLNRRDTTLFYTYYIDGLGIRKTPVISQLGHSYVSKDLSSIKFSKDGKKVLHSVYRALTTTPGQFGFLSIYDFDIKTGQLSNHMFLDTPAVLSKYYGCDFSPDGTKVYASDIGYMKSLLYQFDLTSGSQHMIVASKDTLLKRTTHALGEIRLGPDDILYVAVEDTNHIGMITNPNIAFPGCTYTPKAIVFTNSNTYSRLSLPPLVQYPKYNVDDTVTSSTLISFCYGKETTLKGNDSVGNYLWNNGLNTQNIIADTAGTFWVSSIACRVSIDTFKINVDTQKISLGSDTSICFAPIALSVDSSTNNTTYLWNDGSTNSTISATRSGTYYVTTNTDGCISSDTVNVYIKPPVIFAPTPTDTLLCSEQSYTMYIPPNIDSFVLSNGATTDTITITEAGNYTLTVTKNGCEYTNATNTEYTNGDISLRADTSLCSGDILAVAVSSPIESDYSWSNGVEDSEISITNTGSYIVKATNYCGVFSDTVNVIFNDCQCMPIIPNAFTPNNDGRNDLFGPILGCRTASFELIVVNRFGEVVFRSEDPHNRWNGKYKGQHCDLGTYFYSVRIKSITGHKFFLKGEVLLVR